jgi:hypothetical protein
MLLAGKGLNTLFKATILAARECLYLFILWFINDVST